MRNFGLQLNSNRSSCASNARIKTSVRRAATKHHDLRPWDDCVGWSKCRGLGASREPYLSLFETRSATRSDFAPCYSRSSAGYPRIPNVRLYAPDGSGKTRCLKVPAVSLRAHESYGQHGLTPVDRLGVWLSKRAIHRHLPWRNDLEVLELGCGYRATQLIALEPKLKRGIGVDFHIAPELQRLDGFAFYEGTIEETLPKLENEMADVVLLISVMEHLADPHF